MQFWGATPGAGWRKGNRGGFELPRAISPTSDSPVLLRVPVQHSGLRKIVSPDPIPSPIISPFLVEKMGVVPFCLGNQPVWHRR